MVLPLGGGLVPFALEADATPDLNLSTVAAASTPVSDMPPSYYQIPPDILPGSPLYEQYAAAAVDAAVVQADVEHVQQDIDALQSALQDSELGLTQGTLPVNDVSGISDDALMAGEGCLTQRACASRWSERPRSRRAFLPQRRR